MRNPYAPPTHPLLSKTADYALRALLVLARRDLGRPLSAEAIAEATGTPPNYTSKTLYALGRAGLLRSMRGPTGGFLLAKPAYEISIAEIVDVFADPPRTPRCLLGNRPCDSASPCSAHGHWTRVAAAARHPLVTTTLADLLAQDPGSASRPTAIPSAPGFVRAGSGASFR